MSHYKLTVLLPNDTDIPAQIEHLMAPHRERMNEDESDVIGWWDWYRIGGRWDRSILTDEKAWLAEKCAICEKDSHHHYTNAHEQVANNAKPLCELPEDWTTYAILTPTGEHISRRNPRFISWQDDSQPWDLPNEAWLPEMRRTLAAWPGTIAVVVDYHC